MSGKRFIFAMRRESVFRGVPIDNRGDSGLRERALLRGEFRLLSFEFLKRVLLPEGKMIVPGKESRSMCVPSLDSARNSFYELFGEGQK